MQPGPTSTETSPPPTSPPPAAPEAVAEEPGAAAEEAARPAVKVESPPPVQEEGDEAEEPRRGGRRRKRARGGGVRVPRGAGARPCGCGGGEGVGHGQAGPARALPHVPALPSPPPRRHHHLRVPPHLADHSLQDVRSKLFPFKRKKIKAEEVPSPDSLPTKRKERSISSLVVNTPKVKPTSLTGRRTRAVARKAAAALRGLGPVIEDPVKKEIDSGDNQPQNPVVPANSGKAPQTRRQISSNAETSNHSSNKNVEDDREELTDKGELWQPLNCLVEAANRTKSFRSSSHNAVVKGEQLNGSSSSTYANKTKAREHVQKTKTEDDKKDVPMPQIMLKKRNGTGRRRRQLQAPADTSLMLRLDRMKRNSVPYGFHWLHLTSKEIHLYHR
ncbi:hypothetical protein PR202_ga12723 [Eleusine coracana subsp. coracana]|uniref:Uncharacterized protein n=1 Tax=Eleusine coracana subsp. coracana TaxID=191504 RepID=A0AAV5CCC9_ELECO|nr:hypothetical protein PR202_ga12723 [Eleusine coracana subsp. coracana]